MSGDLALLLRASDLPGVLDGWVGPVDVSVAHPDSYAAGGSAVWWEDGYVLSVPQAGRAYHRWSSTSRVHLDLSRAECRDRVARVVAGRVGLECGATAPRFHMYDRLPIHIILGAELRSWWFWVEQPRGTRPRLNERLVPTLAALDPADPRRLPDGSPWVVAAALKLVAEHVGQS